ncbi:MAG TPA: TlpA disulfide reductase family protein [Candidatus Elarobacter sp.]|jgi:thiol-disulfide isomerase/thioredoxin
MSFIFAACAAGAASSPAAPKAHVHGANGVVTIPLQRPLEMTMQVLDGPDLRLSDYAGKVVFLNIFATWCEPCRDEQPALSAFARAHTDDTAVIGLNYREEDNDVRKYRSLYSVTYPIAMDRQGRILRGIYAGGHMLFPMTMVVAPNRMLFCAWRGDKSREWFEREREAALTHPAEG